MEYGFNKKKRSIAEDGPENNQLNNQFSSIIICNLFAFSNQSFLSIFLSFSNIQPGGV